MVYLLGWEIYNRFENSPSVPEHRQRVQQLSWCSLHHGIWNMDPCLPRARLLPPLWAFTSPGGWD